ncbi:hypothetical protein [Bacteroides salyersiae]|uniref:hypothetical protein n=1 Tax=Bacteroides salyersiae TaxID=291644 RepID=UPI001C8C4607|nr:hypothetical protein [Bacteroides salyersiae]
MKNWIRDYFLVIVLLFFSYIDRIINTGLDLMGFVPILLLGIYNYNIYKVMTRQLKNVGGETKKTFSHDIIENTLKWDPGILISSPVFIYTLFLGVELMMERRQEFFAIFCFVISAIYYSMGVYLHVRRWRIDNSKNEYKN